jgi:hypothetical protein
MKFDVTWEVGAEMALKNLRDGQAVERIARGVHDLSMRGVGKLRRRGTSETEFTLHVGPYAVALTVDIANRHIIVWGFVSR